LRARSPGTASPAPPAGSKGGTAHAVHILGTFIAGDTLPKGYSIPSPRLLGALAATGVVLGAIYLLWMFQKVFFGKLDKAKNGRLPDLDGRELATFIPLVIGIFVMGVYPRPLLVVMEPAVNRFLSDVGRRVAECDGPPHVFGMIPCEQRQADAVKPPGEVARSANAIERTITAGAPRPAAGEPAPVAPANAAAAAPAGAAPAAGTPSGRPTP